MLNEHGYEIPDDTPVAVPARLRLPQSRAAQIQAYIRQELSLKAQAEGQESFDEANDLDVEDMPDFGYTAYEQSAEFGTADLLTAAEFEAAQNALKSQAAGSAPPEQPNQAASPASTPGAGAVAP